METGFKRASEVFKGPRPQDIEFKVASESEEYNARVERKLSELAGQPLRDERGQVIYLCRACRDMQFIRADVPLNHPLFGLVRLCRCSKQFATYGAKWFKFGPGD